jgi:hypothetical protein
MELFTATGKLKVFFTTRDVRCVHHRWHDTHRYDIQVLATHASTWVHRCYSLLQWSVPLGQRGHVAMVGRILCTKCTMHSNHKLSSCDIPTHKTTSPPERPFSHYIHSHRLAEEMWATMKNNLLGKKVLSCSFYLYRVRKYVPYGYPIIIFCNPGVHYETPCMYVYIYIYTWRCVWSNDRMILGWKTEVTVEYNFPMSLRLPHFSHELNWNRTRFPRWQDGD